MSRPASAAVWAAIAAAKARRAQEAEQALADRDDDIGDEMNERELADWEYDTAVIEQAEAEEREAFTRLSDGAARQVWR